VRRPEQTLQIQVANYLRVALRPPTFWTAIDHGAGKMTPASAGLRRARGVRPGLPDILIMHPSGWNTSIRPMADVIGIELKASKGRMSDAQLVVQAAWRKCGCEYEECKSLGELVSLLNRYRIPLHAKLS
jgi:hypothetical protein